MRARYAAYALGVTDFLVRSWHPRTRPDPPPAPDGLSWTRLEVLQTVDGGPADATGTVEFVAEYDGPTGPGRLHEMSRFERRRGEWVYVEPCTPYR